MKIKKIVSVMLALLLCFAVSVPALAVTYSDLNGHWAAEYMNDLAGKGYLSGYSDGTMRPETNMTAAEALVMLSRFYSPSDDETALMRVDFFDTVITDVPATLSWTYNNIIICLAAGIITESELKSINLYADITKEQLSVFLVRTMQLTSAAAKLSGTTLNFADANTITSTCYTSVAELYAIKIVTGDQNNKFQPKASVTRAVVAAMVSRALDYLDDYDKTLVAEDYSGVTRTEGIIKSVGAGTVDIYGLDGLIRECTIPSAAEVSVNDTVKPLSMLYIGCYVMLSLKDNAIYKMEIENASGVKWVQGAVNSISTTSTDNYLYIRDLETGTVTPYFTKNDVAFYENGVSISSSSIKIDDFITLRVENNKYVKGYISSSNHELTGTITKIDYGMTVMIKITDSKGFVYLFPLYFNDLPQILRNNAAISIDRLNVGNTVTVKIVGCTVTKIVSTGTEDTVSGELTSITETKDGTMWTITQDDGTEVSLKVDKNASVYNSTKTLLLSDIKVGDEVSVVIYGEVITEIQLKSSVSSSDKVSGSILSVDFPNKTITLLTSDNKLIYINTTNIVSVIQAGSGWSVNILELVPNKQITAYGAYKDANHFNATAVIIE